VINCRWGCWSRSAIIHLNSSSSLLLLLLFLLATERVFRGASHLNSSGCDSSLSALAMDGLMDCSFSRRSSFLLLLLLLLLFLYIGLLFVVGAVGAGFVVHDGTAGGMGGFCGGCGGGGGVTIHGKLVLLISDGDDDDDDEGAVDGSIELP